MPLLKRTSSGIPGFISDSWRMSFGIINPPAPSKLVFMAEKLPFAGPSAKSESLNSLRISDSKRARRGLTVRQITPLLVPVPPV
jgi:hypothetical protein